MKFCTIDYVGELSPHAKLGWQPKGVSFGRSGEVDIFGAFLFLVPRALLQLTLKGVAQRPMHQNTCLVVGTFLLGQLVCRFYRPPFLPQKPLLGSSQLFALTRGVIGNTP